MLSRWKWAALGPLVLGSALGLGAPAAFAPMPRPRSRSCRPKSRTRWKPAMPAMPASGDPEQHLGDAARHQSGQRRPGPAARDLVGAGRPTTWRFQLIEGAKFTTARPSMPTRSSSTSTGSEPGARLHRRQHELTPPRSTPLHVGFIPRASRPIMPIDCQEQHDDLAEHGDGPESASRPAQGPTTSRVDARPGRRPHPLDGYWGEKPQVEQVTYLFRTNSSVRAAMVETGEADIALDSPTDATDPATDFRYFDSDTTYLPHRRAFRRSTTSASARRWPTPSTGTR